MYHNFLMYSSADGYLGCFHVLAYYSSSDFLFSLCKTVPPLPGRDLLTVVADPELQFSADPNNPIFDGEISNYIFISDQIHTYISTILRTPTGCTTIQHNSNTIYPEVQIPGFEGL